MNKKVIILILISLFIIALISGLIGYEFNMNRERGNNIEPKKEDVIPKEDDSKIDNEPLEVISESDTSPEAMVARACQAEIKSSKCKKASVVKKEENVYEILISEDDRTKDYFEYNILTKKSLYYGAVKDNAEVPDNYYSSGM